MQDPTQLETNTVPVTWLEFLEKHLGKLQNACRDYNHDINPDLWDEVLDVLPRIYNNYDPSKSDNIEAYAWLMLRKYLAKKWKRMQKHNFRFASETVLYSEHEIIPEREDYSINAIHNEKVAEVEGILLKAKKILNADEYYVLYYATIGGFSMDEVAEGRGLSRSWTYEIYGNAIQKLKELLSTH